MKIDTAALRVCGTEVPPRCHDLINHIESSSSVSEFLERLKEVHEWQPQFGKSEMSRWAKILNMCDDVLEKAAAKVGTSSSLAIDVDSNLVPQVVVVMSFTALLFENTFTRSIYNSADHLLALLDTGNMEVLVGVLHLFQVMSKRSRYLSQHVPEAQRKLIGARISAIARCWNGKMREIKMEDCCQEGDFGAKNVLPISYKTSTTIKVLREVQLEKDFATELSELYANGVEDDDERIGLAARLRLVRAFLTSRDNRMLCVVARLIAVSTLVYSRNLLDEWDLSAILQDSFIDDTTKLLLIDKSDNFIIDIIKTEALKTLTSIVSLDRPSKLSFVVDCLGANSYHGFMARMARICVDDLCSGKLGKPGCTSVAFCTALFSLLYHLAGYDSGGEALLSCGLTGTLLSVVSCHSLTLEHITFVTRVVRVIDIMTSLDANSFTSCGGMNIIINRLVFEVDESLKETAAGDGKTASVELCHQQRAALIKSLLNFIKRAIQDVQFAETVSHIMDGGLPTAIKQIVLRCPFFGASLFHNAICVVANFIYQEPTLLTTLQNKGLTDVIIDAVFRKELPASRDVLSSLPNVFSALCLNERGLNDFKAAEPFEHFFRVLVSTKYITAMKRRRNEMSETSVGLGSALDDLIRHQPSLRAQFYFAVGKVLDRLLALAAHERSDLPKCVMSMSNCCTVVSQSPSSSNAAMSSRSASQDDEQNATGNDSSDDEDDDNPSATSTMEVPVSEQTPVDGDLGLSDSVRLEDGSHITPLGEHLLNVAKVLETMVTHNSSAESAEAFIQGGTAMKLVSLLYVKQIPLEVLQSAFPQLVSNIIRFLYQQTRSETLLNGITSTMNDYAKSLTNTLEKNVLANIPEEQVEVMVAQLCALTALCNILMHVSKLASGNSALIKNSILAFWNAENSGSGLLKNLQLLQSKLLFETEAYHLSTSLDTMTASTQTDAEDVEANPVQGSVGAEGVPAKMLSAVQLPNGSWKRSKLYDTAVSRCQRQVSDLIGVLVKIATGGSPRNRRSHETVAAPSGDVTGLATQLFSNHNLTLKSQPNVSPPILMSYMTHWITSFHGMLFDDARSPSKNAYHLMLSAFYFSGCHNTFFKLMDTFVSDDWRTDYPKQTELLQLAWLQLAERLVNPYAIRQSKFRLPDQTVDGKKFSAEKYFNLCQREANMQLRLNFDKLLLEKKNTLTLYKCVMTLYKELLRGLIPAGGTSSKLAKKTPEELKKLLDDVEKSHVDMLVEMGFDREEAINALIEHSSVSEATEYLIAHQHLQDNTQRETEGTSEMAESMKESTAEAVPEEGEGSSASSILEKVEPPDSSIVFTHVCNHVAPAFIRLTQLNDIELAFIAAEFFHVLIEGADQEWVRDILVGQYLCDDLIRMVDYEKNYPGQDENTLLLSSRLHLACLLWDDIWSAYLNACDEKRLHDSVISLLYIVDSFSISNDKQILNKYLAPACLWVDFYDKMWRMRQSQMAHDKVINSISWKYWDADDHGGLVSWINYPPAASHLLSHALYNGKKGVTLTLGGKQYYVNFSDMTQRSAESHTERQISASVRFRSSCSEADIMKSFAGTETLKIWRRDLKLLVPTVISLLGMSEIDSWGTQALLMLTARITREGDIAHEFLRQGGLHVLLNLKHTSHSTDSLLAALIVRHCLDDETSISQVFEKTIRSFVAGNHSPQSRWHHARSRGTRDWLHALRSFAPLCARHPHLFVSVMEKVARKQKDQISVVPSTAEPVLKTLPSNAPVREVVSALAKSLLDTTCTDNSKKAFLTKLLAELAKSYSTVASIITEYIDDSGQSAIVALLDRHLPIMNTESSPDEELSFALRSLVTVIASCNHSPKAQEALVNDMISCLHLAFMGADEITIASKVNAVSDLFLSIRDACPSSDNRSSGPPHPNPMLKLFLKKRVCIELAKVPWHLNLSNERGVGSLNVVLKTLEELTRSINSMTQSASTPTATSEHPSSEQAASASVTLATTSTNDVVATVSVELEPAVVERNGENRNADMQNDYDDRNMEEGARVLAEVLDESDSDDDDDDGDDAVDEPEHNEIDMDAESDEEEEDRDEAIMEEEGRGSDDEDEEDDEEFGLVEMDESGFRFEDGDAEDTFLNADLFIENLDDIENAFAAATLGGTRLFVHTGIDSSRNERNLAALPPPQHPLLQRPAAAPVEAPVTQRPTGYRFMFGTRRPGGVIAPGLHRQGAVRRWGILGQHHDGIGRHNLIGTAMPALGGPHYFDAIPSRQRLFNVLESAAAGAFAQTVERHYTAMPSPAERLVDEARLLDGHTYILIFFITAQHITNLLEAKEKAEKKAEEDAMKESAAQEKSEKRTDVPEPVARSDAATTTKESSVAAVATTDSASNTESQPVLMSPDEEGSSREISSPQEVASTSGLSENAMQISESAENLNAATVAQSESGVSDAAMATSDNGDSIEPMDTTDTAGVFFDAQENVEDGGATPMDANSAANAETGSSNSNASMSTALTTFDGTEAQASTSAGAPEIAPGTSSATSEYANVLGDMEIPEGIDPEFLAALPEDIRAEVIRDHARQQRAQRIVQQSAARDNLEAGSGTAGVEPLDQEFLNALPPELQEEILSQRERDLRLNAERAQPSTSQGDAAVTDANEAAALIESLPPGLRAQVLADADDTVLQVLPQNVAAEARRLRASLEQQQVMRFARMLGPRSFGHIIREAASSQNNGASLGALAGVTTIASKSAVQLLDRDAIVTIVLLAFVEESHLTSNRLQRLIKNICSQSATCDFVIWCFMALLEKLNTNTSSYEDLVGSAVGWIHQIYSWSGLGEHERAIRFVRNAQTVAINPAVTVPTMRFIFETLTSLAKSYPGHFVPLKLRNTEAGAPDKIQSQPFSHFWNVAYSLLKTDPQRVSHRRSSLSSEQSSGLAIGLSGSSLEDSALGMLMMHFTKPTVKKTPQLQDKLLRLLCTIVQTLPDDTTKKLGLEEIAERPPLAEQLDSIVMVLTEGECSEEGLSDGRTLLMEAIRALNAPTRKHLYNLLVSAGQSVGKRLHEQIALLRSQLESHLSEKASQAPEASISFEQRSASSSRIMADRYDSTPIVIEGVANSHAVMNSSGCRELQLPAVRLLTDKNALQTVFLKTLQTIVKIREVLRKYAKKEDEKKEEEKEGPAETSMEPPPPEEERMSSVFAALEPLWTEVSECLSLLDCADAHAALALQPAAEAFFLVYSCELPQIDSAKPLDHPDALRLIQFAEKHKGILNQVLRQNNSSLSDGPFSILIKLPRLLDFDVKRKFFRKQIQKLDERVRGDDIPIRVRRSHLFSDSFRELFRLRSSEWRARFYIIFEGEEGQDAGGLLREWFSVITREIFDPNYALFITAPGDRVTYMINKASYINPEHLDYFKFVGRIIAKAIYENKLLECYFTRAFYKHILSVPVRTQDIESEDPSFYKSLEFLLNNPVETFGTELTFSVEVEEFGVRKMRELKENGAHTQVTDENKEEYVSLVCQMKMKGSIQQQLNAFLEGFYDVIPNHLISMFNEQELELLISGLPNIDVDDLYANTEYKTYTKTSPQIQWFWKALRSFDQEDRAKFLQFVTGTSKVPLQGFSALEGMNGVQKFSIHMDSRSSDRLPAAHTCFNQLDLPQYESYEKLRQMLLLAIRECTEGFGFA